MLPVDATSILRLGRRHRRNRQGEASPTPNSAPPPRRAGHARRGSGRLPCSTVSKPCFEYGAWSWWLLGLLLLGPTGIVMRGFTTLVWFGAAAGVIGILALAFRAGQSAPSIFWAISISILLLIVGGTS